MPSISAQRARPLAALALATAAAVAQAQSAQPITDAQRIEDLTRRLQVLERRSGIAAPQADADAAPEGAPEGASVADLDQRLRILERRLELQDEAATAKAATAPVAALTAEKGLSVKSAGGDVELKFRGLIQGDGRFFVDDDAAPQNDTFLLRRVEPTIEGSWGKLIGFRIQAQLAGDSASLNDAYADLKFDPRATLRIGKFKAPFGLEQLQPTGALAAIERGLPTELTPARDYGLQLQGEFAGGEVTYAAGVFNGTVDGRDAVSSNPDNEFEAAARLTWEPWKNAANPLSGLGVGIAASSGDKQGGGNNALPRYRTPGQAQFFGYRSAALADGQHLRWSPQAWFYRNAFGLQAEYVRSEQALLLPGGGLRADLEHRAWQATAGYVLTGEDAGYRGVAKPNNPFTPGDGGWGAFEVVARYGELDVDDDAFPLFADPAASASEARAWSLGLNWYLTGNFKLVANYTQTAFDGGTTGSADRDDEKAFFTRAQFQF